MRKEGHTNQYLPKLQMEHYNVMIDHCNIFCQPIQNNWNITTGQVDDYTTSCLLYCDYFKEKWWLIEIDLSI